MYPENAKCVFFFLYSSSVYVCNLDNQWGISVHVPQSTCYKEEYKIV